MVIDQVVNSITRYQPNVQHYTPNPQPQALIPEPDLRLIVAERWEDGRKVHVDNGSIPLLNSVLWSGLLTAFSLALHNFPGTSAARSLALLHPPPNPSSTQ